MRDDVTLQRRLSSTEPIPEWSWYLKRVCLFRRTPDMQGFGIKPNKRVWQKDTFVDYWNPDIWFANTYALLSW